MSTAVSITNLVKTFGSTRALDGLDLDVARGEVHGYLGPNGSGKTVTIRILLGLLRHDSGDVRLLGGDPWYDAVDLHRRLAYVPGDVNLWPNMSGGEIIDLLTRLRGGVDRRKRDALVERLALDPSKKSRTYSKGNRQKVALVAALATPAELYLLDEPTSGLDPLMEQVFNREIARVAADGATVLLSSHILSEVEELCDRVTIIKEGKTVESGTMAELRHLTRTEIAFSADSVPMPFDGVEGAHDLLIDHGRVSFTVDSDRVAGVLPELARLDVKGLTVSPPSLEELFLRHYGDEFAALGQAPRS
jgi:ABC-2 type transport system ATP-binding protein